MGTNESLLSRKDHLLERCPECGRAAIAAASCTACGFEVVSGPGLQGDSAVSVRTSKPFAIPSTATTAIRHRVSVASNSGINVSSTFPRDSITGRVLLVMPPASEPMDPDPWKWLAVPLWGIILFASPIVGGLITLQTSGWLSAAIAFLVLASVLRFLFSSSLFWSWQTVAALRGRHVVEPMPVTMLRVRLGNDQEVQLRMKGHTEGGAVAAGDRVEATGSWLNGVLRVSELRCRRTGAVLKPRQPRALPWLLVATGVLILMWVWFQVSYMPWMHNTNLLNR